MLHWIQSPAPLTSYRSPQHGPSMPMPLHAPRRSRLLVPAAAAVLLVCGFWTTNYVFLSEPPAPPPETDSLSHLRPVDAESDVTPPPPPPPTTTQGPVTSVLHPRAAFLPALTADQQPEVRPEAKVTGDVVQWTEYFPQHGQPQRGVHWRLQNRRVLGQTSEKAHDAVLLLVVLKDHRSYGLNRSSTDLFALLGTFTVPKAKVSLTVLVSDMQEFDAVQRNMHRHIAEYAQFSLIFRSDFNARGLTRENRHDTGIQNERRRLLARYRNFALLSTLETWHQHVVWIDADVERVPAHLMAKMMRSGLDIVEPICYRDEAEYDRNAWVGTRTKPKDASERKGFVPMGLRDRHMIDYRDGDQEFIPLDSVGGTMLYVKADIHRQGVLFTHHYVIGSEWDQEGYDGIETEGLCYEAHFFGYKCWGMPREPIHHVGGASMAN
jgi:hypothetical protein